MKFLLSVGLLFSSVIVSAETVKLSLPDAGRYIITLSSQASCSSTQFTIIPKHTSWSDKGTALLTAGVAEVIETRGRAQWCSGGDHVATGIVMVMESTEVEIDLEGANGALISPEIKIESAPVK